MLLSIHLLSKPKADFLAMFAFIFQKRKKFQKGKTWEKNQCILLRAVWDVMLKTIFTKQHFFPVVSGFRVQSPT